MENGKHFLFHFLDYPEKMENFCQANEKSRKWKTENGTEKP